MGRLNEIGIKYGTDKASSNHNYLDFYESNLPKNPKRVLEVGVFELASLKMWHEFYPDAELIGIDVREPMSIDGVTVLKMNSRDVYALKKLGKFDLIIDDGSHIQLDQQVFMQFALDNMLTDGGVFVMEDLHCSYWDVMKDDSHQTTEEVIKELEDRYKVTYFIHEDKTQHYAAIIK